MSCAYCQRVGLAASPFSSSAIGLVGTRRAVGRVHRQEDRAEPVRDVEVRIERGRQVEQRLEQLEPPVDARRLAVAAVVLDRANPVHVGGQRIERQEERGRPTRPDRRCSSRSVDDGQWPRRLACAQDGRGARDTERRAASAPTTSEPRGAIT